MDINTVNTALRTKGLNMAIIHIYLLLFLTTSVLSQGCPNTNQCSCENNDAGQLILYCRDNNLQSVPIFSSTSYVFEDLTLANNQITTLLANAFKTTSGTGLNTRILDLSSNPIATIHTNAFSGLEQYLEVLILHVNAMNSFPTAAIQGLTKLKEIRFKGFNIDQLPTNALSSLTRLEILNLEDCKLTKLNTGDFSSQVDILREVYLVKNKFNDVPKAGLNTLNTLQVLDLAQNTITNIVAGSFTNLGGLQELTMSQNGVNTISGTAFQGLENSLKKLSLSNNLQIITSHLPAIQLLSSLEDLDLSYNIIDSIPTNFFSSMSNLRKFTCNNNRINALTSQNFRGLNFRFEELILFQNRITSIGADTFSSLNALKMLDIHGNPILYNPDIFKGLENTLETLSLRDTAFSVLSWSSITKLSKLTNLKLDRNNINSIPDGTFTNLNKLSTLNLEQNSINQLEQAALKGLQTSLTQLFLNNNDINTLHECLFFNYQNTVEIQLDGNPLHCDCQIQWLRDWIYDSSDPNINFWQCSTPANHANKYLKDIANSDLVCATTPVEKTCEDYTATTTTPTPPTLPSTPAGPVYPLTLNISQIMDTSMVVAWIVYSTDGISGWELKCTAIVSGEIEFFHQYNVDTRHGTIEGLTADTEYSLCVKAVMGNANNQQTDNAQTCTSEHTMPEASGVYTRKDILQIALACGLGVVFLLIVIGVGICCFVKYRNSRSPPIFKEEEGLSNDGSFVPQVGDQSRRFSKPKSMLLNMNASTENLDRTLNGFTPEERNRILKLFSTSGASTLTMMSSVSQRYSQEPQSSRAPYGAGSHSLPLDARRPGYLNPMQVSQELGRHDSGEYQQIPADTYDEIPIDRIGEENGAYNMPYEEGEAGEMIAERPKSTGDILNGSSYI